MASSLLLGFAGTSRLSEKNFGFGRDICYHVPRSLMKRKNRISRKAKLPSLGVLARQLNPLDEPAILMERLKLETSESRHLEWKITAPIGSTVTKKVKCRMLKALISFANTDGGFIVFGIDPKGRWVGLTESEINDTDPANIAEFVNECVSPELAGLNYGLLRKAKRFFPVLHIPPSQLMPHVTTKEFGNKLADGTNVIYIRKHAVYCRFAGKSDLATASQYARIIAQRTEMLRKEMLRVVRKVDLPATGSLVVSRADQKPIVRVSRLTTDKTAPAVRITRDPTEASEIIVQEELSQAIFSEINNVLDANRLLAPNDLTFVLGDNVYYRIYAERHLVESNGSNLEMLATTALAKLYAPSFFWLLALPAKTVAKVISSISADIHMRAVCRLAIMLGSKAIDWFSASLDEKWKGYSQPPGHYHLFNKMKIDVASGANPILIALQQSANSRIISSVEQKDISVKDLLEDRQLAGNLLSATCRVVFENNNTDDRAACRQLDIVAYGADLPKRCDAILAELAKLEI